MQAQASNDILGFCVCPPRGISDHVQMERSYPYFWRMDILLQFINCLRYHRSQCQWTCSVDLPTNMSRSFFSRIVLDRTRWPSAVSAWMACSWFAELRANM